MPLPPLRPARTVASPQYSALDRSKEFSRIGFFGLAAFRQEGREHKRFAGIYCSLKPGGKYNETFDISICDRIRFGVHLRSRTNWRRRWYRRWFG
jgi:hypothetical protein